MLPFLQLAVRSVETCVRCIQPDQNVLASAQWPHPSHTCSVAQLAEVSAQYAEHCRFKSRLRQLFFFLRKKELSLGMIALLCFVSITDHSCMLVYYRHVFLAYIGEGMIACRYRSQWGEVSLWQHCYGDMLSINDNQSLLWVVDDQVLYNYMAHITYLIPWQQWLLFLVSYCPYKNISHTTGVWQIT